MKIQGYDIGVERIESAYRWEGVVIASSEPNADSILLCLNFLRHPELSKISGKILFYQTNGDQFFTVNKDADHKMDYLPPVIYRISGMIFRTEKLHRILEEVLRTCATNLDVHEVQTT
jgi:hypothetical protein